MQRTLFSTAQRDGKTYETYHEVWDESFPDTDTIAMFWKKEDGSEDLVHRMIIGDFIRFIGISAKFLPRGE